ncbi:MAG: hypothetical protein D6766_08025 [Verrucomicrobia bacterium]|nr:MAG: hypothetical protein D6766_08025 [Verrucomicrobiota bacterium]
MKPGGQGTSRERRRRGVARADSGAILLEVVLALVLFVFAAAVIGGGLNAALNKVEALRRECHAADLAATVLAEVQLGMRPLQNSGWESLEEPFADWNARVEVVPYTFGWDGGPGLSLVTVVVRGPEERTHVRLSGLASAVPWRAGVTNAAPGSSEPADLGLFRGGTDEETSGSSATPWP